MSIYICPGSFDPITNGHVDIIERAVRHCDHLIVAVGINRSKRSFFTIEEKLMLLNKVFDGHPNVEITSFTGLTGSYAIKRGADAIIRGLRALSDFEYEFQMALLNRKLNPQLETLFIMTNPDYSFVSSGAVRELLLNDGDLTNMVPDCIRDDLVRLVKEKKQ